MASRRKRSPPARMVSAERLNNLSPMRGLVASGRRLVFDGGLATQLEAMGEDLTGDLWSARLLLEAPHTIVQAHSAFLEAGADLIITASYQCSVPLLVSTLAVDESRAEALIADSVTIADRARRATSRPDALVAASVGPYGACLCDGSEYTGTYSADVGGTMRDTDLIAWHRRRFELLAGAACVDVLAFETLPCRAEARALVALLREAPHAKAYVSFSCKVPRPAM